MADRGLRVAIVGGGVSGITAAHVLQKQGHQAVVFEKMNQVGGIWAVSYPQVRLQNLRSQYYLSDFPWPFRADFHPTADQVMRYWSEAIERFGLDVRLGHEVQRVERGPDAWLVRYRTVNGDHEESFDLLVIASGQFLEKPPPWRIPGQDGFVGRVMTERDLDDLGDFDGKQVAVVGFGKSALDVAVLAAQRASQVWHVFRTPRWVFPEHLLGVHSSRVVFSRFGSVMVPSWAHPSRPERLLHARLEPVVTRYWRMVAALFRLQAMSAAWGKGRGARERLRLVLPTHDIRGDFRSAGALAPMGYFSHVAKGRIQPVHGEIAGFTPTGLLLSGERHVPAELVVLSVGSATPAFPYLPPEYRTLLEGEPDGVQLYRHVIHPRIPALAFAGFNHGFMHVPAVEVGMLWLCAYLRGDLVLPTVEEMERSMQHIQAWKRAHIAFEPSRSCNVNLRFQQYIDILLADLGVSPYRKLPNVLAEVFARYGPEDYRGVVGEYERQRQRGRHSVAAVAT